MRRCLGAGSRTVWSVAADEWSRTCLAWQAPRTYVRPTVMGLSSQRPPLFIHFGSSGCLGFGCLCGLTVVGITIVPLLRISLALLTLCIDGRPRCWQIPCAAMHFVCRICLSDVCRVSRISVPTLSGLRVSSLQADGVARTHKFVAHVFTDMSCSLGIHAEGTHSAHARVYVHILNRPERYAIAGLHCRGTLPSWQDSQDDALALVYDVLPG